MKQWLCIVAMLGFAAVNAQDKIQTQRPGETQSAQTLEKKTFQVETGFAKEKLEGNDKVQQQPEVIIRYGLFSRLELRLNLTVEVQDLASENIYRDGFRPIEPGIQAVLYETKD